MDKDTDKKPYTLGDGIALLAAIVVKAYAILIVWNLLGLSERFGFQPMTFWVALAVYVVIGIVR